MRDGWKETTLGEVSIRVKEKNKSQIDKVFTVSAEHGLIDQEKFFNKRVASKNLLGYTVVRPGMLVYNKSYSAGAPYGVITRSHHLVPGVVSPLYTVFEPREEKVIGRYLELASNSSLFFSSLKQFIKEGGRAHGGITISLRDFFDCTVPLPPLDEQKRIVDVVSSVDAYIKALQQQADSARTARNAVLHELLSAGGDDWTETTLGDIAEVVGGGTPSTTKEEFWDGDVIWLTPTEVTAIDGKVISDSKRKITKAGLQSSGARVLPKGTVILTSRASVGFVALAGTELTTNQGFQSLIPSERVDGVFLMFWIQINRAEFESRSAGSTFKEISKSNVKSIAIKLPPLVEQKRIVDVVSSIDDVIQSTEPALAEAKSLRSGLLSDLLSGEHEFPQSYDKFVGAA